MNSNSYSDTSKIIRVLYFFVAPFLVVMAGFLAYSNSFQGVFLLDDESMIVDNPTIRSLTPLSKFIFEGGLRKLPVLSFAANYAMSGLNPTGYHYFNVAVHLLAAVCLYGLVFVTFNSQVWSAEQRSQAALIAFLISLLWVVHPLNTQAVDYIVQRIESMMGLAFFLFLLLYANAQYSKYRRTLLSAAWCVFCLGLLCKEVMVMSLPVAMLYDRAFLSSSWREVFRSRGLFWFACAFPLALAAFFIIPTMLGSNAAVGLSLKSVTPAQYLSTQPEVILHYLRLVVVPWPQVFDYGWEPETQRSNVLIASTVLVVLLASLAWLFTRKPQLAFWGLAAALVLLPTSSFVPLQDLAVEHRMYVPLAFVLVLGVLSIFFIGSKLFGDHPTLITSVVCLGLSGVLAMLTISRNQDYKSEIGMWEDVITKTTRSGTRNMLVGRAYSNLGNAYADKEQWEKSIEFLEKALACQQFASSVYGNLTRAYVATGKIELAKKHCVKAIELDPESGRLRQQAGLIEIMEGNYAEAEQHFRLAHQMSPSDSIIMVNLAQCNLQLGNAQEAESLLRKAIDMDGKSPEPRKRLVDLLTRKSDLNAAMEAATDYAQAVPNDPLANLQLALIWAAKGESAKSVEQLVIASQFDPPPAEANYLLGNARRVANDLTGARRCYETELKYYPKNADALSKLAELVARDNPQLALSYFQRVIELAPGAWQPRYNMAAVHAMLGKKDLAREQLLQVLKINSEYEPAKLMLKSLE
ncbi:MAG: tetratricopeptide repeat protein [Pirellulaceae bacterium]|nr:tetratricopeptide repeat protein [Pirellulaceae bacterium]